MPGQYLAIDPKGRAVMIGTYLGSIVVVYVVLLGAVYAVLLELKSLTGIITE